MRELSYEEIEQQEAYSMTNLWSEYTTYYTQTFLSYHKMPICD